MAILTAHGIQVQEGVLGPACARFHEPFFKLISTGLPWAMLKLALGADGATGPEGQSTQVTTPEIQQLADALRRASEAIVVGRWTVQVDDPLLTDRWHAPTAPHRQSLRVVLDSHGRLPEDRKVWRPAAGQPVLRAVVEDLPSLRGVECTCACRPAPMAAACVTCCTNWPPAAWAGCCSRAAGNWPATSWTWAWWTHSTGSAPTPRPGASRWPWTPPACPT